MDFGWFELSLGVRDIERSVEFYEKLGFQLLGRDEKRNATLQKDDCRITLYQGLVAPADHQLTFWQGDTQAISSELQKAGLSVERTQHGTEGGTAVLLRDPDGHAIVFISVPGVTRRESA